MAFEYRRELTELFSVLSSEGRISILSHLANAGDVHYTVRQLHKVMEEEYTMGAVFSEIQALETADLVEPDIKGAYGITKLGKYVLSELDKLGLRLGKPIREINEFMQSKNEEMARMIRENSDQ
ncbi:MAG: hypothetical protein J4452_00925 [Candidatus Aenigmarchaeota archaeon]|nr:hypothetical protein [Candidatus Aenigmarchaeota archaeon]